MKFTSKTLANEILKELDTSDILISSRGKNKEFMIKYHITPKDVKEYLNLLTPQNFEGKIVNEDKNLRTDYLYSFIIGTTLTDECGERFVNIYIKICKIQDSGIFVVSIHECEYLNRNIL